MRYISIFIFLCLLFSCNESAKVRMDDFKKGKFRTVLEDNETISYATRNDTIQIEEYNGTKDTFLINWIDQFEYVLLKKTPKTLLDSTPFHVKITSVKKNNYSFNAYYKGSNFKQKGTAEKLD